jgi:hypothetical protein
VVPQYLVALEIWLLSVFSPRKRHRARVGWGQGGVKSTVLCVLGNRLAPQNPLGCVAAFWMVLGNDAGVGGVLERRPMASRDWGSRKPSRVPHARRSAGITHPAQGGLGACARAHTGTQG